LLPRGQARQWTSLLDIRPSPATSVSGLEDGIQYSYYEGDWNVLPDFSKLTPSKQGVLSAFDLSPLNQPEYFGLEYRGFVRVPDNGVYGFSTDSDDGSRLYIDDNLLVDNDGLHGMKAVKGIVALGAGLHKIKVQYFQKGGGRGFNVSLEGPKGEKQIIPGAMLFHQK
jgi:hypothetical protein